MNNNNNYWIAELDYLRGFAIIAVVIVHVTAYFNTIPEINSLLVINVFFNTFSHYANELFIFISGMVLSIKYWEDYKIGSFYKKRLLSVIPQYIIFSFIYLLFYYLFDGWKPDISSIIKMIISADVAYHFWFFTLIIQLYLFFPIIAIVYNYCSVNNKLFLLLALGLFINLTRGLNEITHIVSLSYIFYFLLGIYFGRNQDVFKKHLSKKTIYFIIFIFLASGVFMSLYTINGIYTYGNFNSIPFWSYYKPVAVLELILNLSTIFVILQITRLLMRKFNILSNIAYKIGRLSYGIYLIHVIFIIFLFRLLHNIGIQTNDWSFYPIIFFITIIGSYFIIYILSYIPYSKYIVGVHSKLN